MEVSERMLLPLLVKGEPNDSVMRSAIMPT